MSIKVNTKYGDQKQVMREWAYNQVAKQFNGNRALRALTFPSTQGIEGIKGKRLSYEGLLLKHFKNLNIIGLESVGKRYRQIIRKNSDLLNKTKRLTLLNSSDLAWFASNTDKIDIAWLDYFGGMHNLNIKALKTAFDKQIFSNGAILEYTLCESPRTKRTRMVKTIKKCSKDGSIEDGFFRYVKNLASRYGYRLSLKACYKYCNHDNAEPMMTMVLKLVTNRGIK